MVISIALVDRVGGTTIHNTLLLMVWRSITIILYELGIGALAEEWAGVEDFWYN